MRTSTEVLSPFAYEEITVDTSGVKKFTAGTWAPAGQRVARRARVVVAGQGIRFREDSATGNPTTTAGIPKSVGDDFNVDGVDAVSNFRAIAQTGSATLYVTYYR